VIPDRYLFRCYICMQCRAFLMTNIDRMNFVWSFFAASRVQVPRSTPLLIDWPVGQAVKTPPFHGGITGSSPVRVTNIFINIVIFEISEDYLSWESTCLTSKGSQVRTLHPPALTLNYIAGWSSLVARVSDTSDVSSADLAPDT